MTRWEDSEAQVQCGLGRWTISEALAGEYRHHGNDRGAHHRCGCGCAQADVFDADIDAVNRELAARKEPRQVLRSLEARRMLWDHYEKAGVL